LAVLVLLLPKLYFGRKLSLEVQLLVKGTFQNAILEGEAKFYYKKRLVKIKIVMVDAGFKLSAGSLSLTRLIGIQ